MVVISCLGPMLPPVMCVQVFQCLLIGGENAGPGALRNAEKFVVTDEQFESFIQRHKSVPQVVPESNTKMRDSYLILDEYVSYSIVASFPGL